PFGGKTVIFGGDFRQTLPIVLRAGRADIVDACIKRSYMWQTVQVLKLTINMRIRVGNADGLNLSALHALRYGRVGYTKYDIDIPLEHQCSGSPVNDLIDEVFADLQHHQGDLEYLVSRANLCPKSSR
ncbi:TPA: hypothetical protein N0F65_011796, partial [Lagenidium giganteum]